MDVLPHISSAALPLRYATKCTFCRRFWRFGALVVMPSAQGKGKFGSQLCVKEHVRDL